MNRISEVDHFMLTELAYLVDELSDNFGLFDGIGFRSDQGCFL